MPVLPQCSIEISGDVWGLGEMHRDNKIGLHGWLLKILENEHICSLIWAYNCQRNFMQLQGASPTWPMDPAGALPSYLHYRLVLCACHVAHRTYVHFPFTWSSGILAVICQHTQLLIFITFIVTFIFCRYVNSQDCNRPILGLDQDSVRQGNQPLWSLFKIANS